MTNHILLKTSSRCFLILCLLSFLPAIGLAQATGPETKLEQLQKIQAAPTQQIIAARNWGVPESDGYHAPKHGVIGFISRHPVWFALAGGAAIGGTVAYIYRHKHCPGPYKSGDPPCYDNDGTPNK